jgi:tetratricopeptide (TPR) repeat protein
MNLIVPGRLAGWLVASLLLCVTALGEAVFDQALAAFEKGAFSEAAAGFERVLTNGTPKFGALYNLGNARYRNGEPGRAIAAWRQAGRAEPLNAYVRHNLAFARRQLGTPEPPAWAGWIGRLSITGWGFAAAAAAWCWAALLAVCRTCPHLAHRLRGLLVASGILTVVLLAGYSAALALRASEMNAVVIARGAGARYGPVEESQFSHPLADGAEVRVEEEVRGWLRVVDPSGRTGWLPAEQVIRIEN